LSLKEVLEATGGCRLQGEEEQTFTGVSTDSRTLTPGELFVALKGRRFDGHQFVQEAARRGARGLLIQRPLPLPDGVAAVGVPDTLRALGDLAAWWRDRLKAPVIGITGSCGKTTAKEMVARIFGLKRRVSASPGNYNNLIGLPLSLLRAPLDAEAVVLEMGMSVPGEIGRLSQIARPTVGAVTNVAPVHLEGLSSLEAVREAKAEILQGLGGSSTFVYNGDDPHVKAIARRFSGEKVPFGKGEDTLVRAREIRPEERGTTFTLLSPWGEVPLRLKVLGEGGVYSALCAAACALAVGATLGEVKGGLEAFEPLPMRMELLELGGVKVINDAYNSNPAAVEAALKVLASRGGRRIAVLGDMAELGDQAKAFHLRVGELCAELGLEGLFLLGDLAPAVAQGARDKGLNGHVFIAQDHEELAEALSSFLKRGDWLLIKGSRIMAMERVLEGLQGRLQG